MNRFKRFILNGMLMTAVSLLMRTVSVSFNVYLSNTIGPVAMGLFTLISTVYGFAVTLATSGIQLASTRLVSEALTNDQADHDKSLRCIMKKCIGYALIFSFSTALILFSFSPLIGKHWLKDIRTISSLKLLALSLPAISLSSAFSGYFIAVRRVHKNAVISITEQGVKITLSILLLSFFFAKDVESACLAVVAGSVIADLTGCFFQYCFYVAEQKRNKKENFSKQQEKAIQKKLLHIALPVAFSAYVRSGLVTLEHLLIPLGLEQSGHSREKSLATYGTVHSMVFPLILFPSALSASFAGLLIPEMAEAKSTGNTERIASIASRVFQSVLTFSIGVAGIFLFLANEIGATIYPNTSAAKYIMLVAPLIPVMYLDTAVDSMLKGLGEQIYTMGVNIADSLMSVILVWFLIPKFGINGYLITIYFTEIINATLSITRLLNVTGIKPHIFSWIGKPLFAAIFSTTSVQLLLSHITPHFQGKAALFFYICFSALLYLATLFVMGATHLRKRSHPFKSIFQSF